jgi:phasin family protein
MATTPNFPDFTKFFSFSEFKNPAVDFNQIVAQARRNAETFSTVAQIATEGLQTIGRRQLEILRSNGEHALKASKELSSATAPQQNASKQAEFAKTWIDYNVNALREIAELSTKSVQEAFDVVNKRVAEQYREFSDAASNTAQNLKKKAA